jgi:hypothetical protein
VEKIFFKMTDFIFEKGFWGHRFKMGLVENNPAFFGQKKSGP